MTIAPAAQRLSADEANSRFAAGQNSAYALEPKLARQYEASLLATGRRCVAAYRARTQVLTAAMPPKPEGTPQNISQPPQPTVDEVLDAALAAASAEARTLATRRRVSAAVAGEILSGFGSIPELRPLLEPMVRSQAGAQAERLVAGTRDAVANALLDALVEGWSVDTTADYLGAVLKEQAKWRATMLARTDLIALSNGAAQDAVLILGNDGPQFKTWITAGDERVREDHQLANRQTVGVGEPFNVGGAMLQYPGDPLGPDSEIINCRCAHVFSDTATPVLRHSFEGGNLMSDQLAVAASANNEEECSCGGNCGCGGSTSGSTLGTGSGDSPAPNDELDALLASFDPAKHPRNPATGRDDVESPGDGGKFKGGGGAMSPQSSQAFLDNNYGTWREGLSDSETTALAFYQSPGYEVMNGQLRGAEPKVDASVAARAKTATKNLRVAIAKAPPLSVDTTVYREFDGDQFSLKAGETFSDEGFVSTSLHRDGAVSQGATKKIEATIVLPKGTKAAAGYTKELILPPGAKFKVVSAGKGKVRLAYEG